uniref:Uncharacterized protein n=1 Tax=Anguilla anguilla TaxID=7936 RepID=A0A0E9TGW0_ANGAN
MIQVLLYISVINMFIFLLLILIYINLLLNKEHCKKMYKSLDK